MAVLACNLLRAGVHGETINVGELEISAGLQCCWVSVLCQIRPPLVLQTGSLSKGMRTAVGSEREKPRQPFDG